MEALRPSHHKQHPIQNEGSRGVEDGTPSCCGVSGRQCRLVAKWRKLKTVEARGVFLDHKSSSSNLHVADKRVKRRLLICAATTYLERRAPGRRIAKSLDFLISRTAPRQQLLRLWSRQLRAHSMRGVEKPHGGRLLSIAREARTLVLVYTWSLLASGLRKERFHDPSSLITSYMSHHRGGARRYRKFQIFSRATVAKFPRTWQKSGRV